MEQTFFSLLCFTSILFLLNSSRGLQDSKYLNICEHSLSRIVSLASLCALKVHHACKYAWCSLTRCQIEACVKGVNVSHSFVEITTNAIKLTLIIDLELTMNWQMKFYQLSTCSESLVVSGFQTFKKEEKID